MGKIIQWVGRWWTKRAASEYGTCEHCAAAVPVTDPNDLRSTKLVCRRYPPTTTAVAVRQGQRDRIIQVASWPVVQATDGCWEWWKKSELGLREEQRDAMV